jgi:hypothetical protein
LSLDVVYNDTKLNSRLHGKEIAMTAKEKAKLVSQAGKFYTLGLTVEKCREKLS